MCTDCFFYPIFCCSSTKNSQWKLHVFFWPLSYRYIFASTFGQEPQATGVCSSYLANVTCPNGLTVFLRVFNFAPSWHISCLIHRIVRPPATTELTYGTKKNSRKFLAHTQWSMTYVQARCCIVQTTATSNSQRKSTILQPIRSCADAVTASVLIFFQFVLTHLQANSRKCWKSLWSASRHYSF